MGTCDPGFPPYRQGRAGSGNPKNPPPPAFLGLEPMAVPSTMPRAGRPSLFPSTTNVSLMARLSETFFAETQKLQERVLQANRDRLRELGAKIGASIAQGGILHLFGSGHSAMVALEIIGRAGALVPVSGIQDPNEGRMENLPGYGTLLVERYARVYGMRKGELIVVVSNSGRNASPIEVALESKKRGLSVVAVSSLEMSRASTSAHESGKRLFEIADYVLDNGGVPGDAIVPVAGAGMKAGPTSTLTGAMLMNLLMLETVQFLHENGHDLPVLRSQNTEGGMEHNLALAERYRGRLSRPL